MGIIEKWFTWDIESTDWINFKIACVYDGKKRYYADTPNALVDIFERLSGQGVIFWAHYGGKFDIKFILDILIERYDCRYKVVGSSLVQVSIYKGRKKIMTFRDSFNVLPSSLRELGKSFNTTQKLQVDRTNIEVLSQDELEEYVAVDCIVLYEVLFKAKEKFGVEKFRLTIASQAFYDWNQGVDVKDYSCVASYYDYFRSGYYGGWVDVFKRYGTNLNYYDVSSMYPWAMRENTYPKGKYMEVSEFDNDRHGMYNVIVETPKKMIYPCIPHRDNNGKLRFPLGRWEGVYTDVEIRYAKQFGYKFQIIRGVVWEEKGRPFKEYINKWYGLKKESKKKKDKAMTYIAKLHLNTLYGKFAQRRFFRKIVSGLSKEMLKQEALPLFPELDLYTVEEEDRRPFIMTHLSAFVTAYSRIKLHMGMMDVHKQGGTVYYCDTDSLTCDRKLPEGNDLGCWELERKIDEGIFIFPKVYVTRYMFDIKIKAKGFDGRKLCYNDFQNALGGDYSSFQTIRECIVGLFEASRRSMKPLTVIQRKRKLLGKFDKRKLIRDFETEPVRIEEEC